MKKTVDATKGNLTVTGATLSVDRLELITISPTEVVPFWRVVLSLKADNDLLTLVTKEFPFNINVNPVQTIKNNVTAADLNGWTVTRFVDEA